MRTASAAFSGRHAHSRSRHKQPRKQRKNKNHLTTPTDLDAAELDRETGRVLVLVLLGVPGNAPEVSVRLEDASDLRLRGLRGEVVHDEASLLVAEAGVELDAEVHGRPGPRSLLRDERPGIRDKRGRVDEMKHPYNIRSTRAKMSRHMGKEVTQLSKVCITATQSAESGQRIDYYCYRCTFPQLWTNAQISKLAVSHVHCGQPFHVYMYNASMTALYTSTQNETQRNFGGGKQTQTYTYTRLASTHTDTHTCARVPHE